MRRRGQDDGDWGLVVNRSYEIGATRALPSFAPLHELALPSVPPAAVERIADVPEVVLSRIRERLLEPIRQHLDEVGFAPSLIEVSYFGLSCDSLESSGFISAIWSQEFRCASYIRAMQENIEMPTNSGFDVGPIVPSRALYKHRYWTSQPQSDLPSDCASSHPDLNSAPAAVVRYPPGKGQGMESPPAEDEYLQLRGYILGFHQRIILALSNSDLDPRDLAELLIIPFPRWIANHAPGDGSDGMEPRGGALFAFGRFTDPAVPENERHNRCAALSHVVARAATAQVAWHAAQAEQAVVEAKRQGDWRCFTAGISHGFKRDAGAFTAVIKQARMEAPGMSSKLDSGLAWMEATSSKRGRFFSFMQDLALSYLSGQPDRLGHDARHFVSRPQLEEWLCQLARDIRAPYVLSAEFAQENVPSKWLAPKWSLNISAPETLTLSPATIYEYTITELLTNAIKNCADINPIRVDFRAGDGAIEVRTWNDLALQIRGRSGTCPICGTHCDGPLRTAAMYFEQDAARCPSCLTKGMAEHLTHVFRSGYTRGGSGLGLFLIQFLVSEVLRGDVVASVADSGFTDVSATPWSEAHGVCFCCRVPFARR